eukprot:CAMPEP_0172646364 /NCGR_PEP_ID=MMETSP1068-20121228/240204_1 /TAXON_ID=35684 /ORGANISM="Pseudopedinella elastica, Strain CCMP716" /LENGTH=345 /DNA_ID=CAMNT_0013460621 /DNA_START=347 /DNA_END=1385 /DNA_ORIENTATION=-
MAEISYEKPIPRVSAEQGGRLFRYEFSDPGGRPLSFGVALRLLQEEEGPNSFSAQLSGLLLETKIPAFFWECRPVMPEKLDSTPFEFVVVAAAELEGVPADQNTFEEHFSKPSQKTGKSLARAAMPSRISPSASPRSEREEGAKRAQSEHKKLGVRMERSDVLPPGSSEKAWRYANFLSQVSLARPPADGPSPPSPTWAATLTSWRRARSRARHAPTRTWLRSSPTPPRNRWPSCGGPLRALFWPVASFANLGGDSYLVAPSPVESPPRPYPHLAAFLANAPPQQVAKLWRTVAGVVLTRAEQVAGAANRPFWLSTSGLGVYWLHVRIDRRPKYYTHLPYKDPGY